MNPNPINKRNESNNVLDSIVDIVNNDNSSLNEVNNAIKYLESLNWQTLPILEFKQNDKIIPSINNISKIHIRKLEDRLSKDSTINLLKKLKLINNFLNLFQYNYTPSQYLPL